jgi:hypothetical protein
MLGCITTGLERSFAFDTISDYWKGPRNDCAHLLDMTQIYFLTVMDNRSSDIVVVAEKGLITFHLRDRDEGFKIGESRLGIGNPTTCREHAFGSIGWFYVAIQLISR